MTSDTPNLRGRGPAGPGHEPAGPGHGPAGPGHEPVGSERGQAIRRARAVRVRTIRRRVVSGAVALFVAAWLLIAAVLVSGHDPALAARKTSIVGAPTGSSSGSSPVTTSSKAASGKATSGKATSGKASSGQATSSSATGGANSSVTTRQS